MPEVEVQKTYTSWWRNLVWNQTTDTKE
jgi:hypothetical protein